MRTLNAEIWQITVALGGSSAAAGGQGSLSCFPNHLHLKTLCPVRSSGKPILPPRGETAETCHTAEKAVVKAVLCGTGNFMLPVKAFPRQNDTAKQFLEINSKPPTVIQAAIPTILKDTPIEFFHRRQSFLKDKADLAISKLKDIPSLKCYLKPEACTFLWESTSEML
ncbi:hypothetical protein Bca52824_093194 [Brassica carinata]|uniref:Uncharacterized protein n=1 Tax=Brassica carinata TaxID=52824 RepID=A0A8X7P301_BRACI|nr:hypothetical protein Bca52824_093194 [Brassica carinata]